MNATNVLTDMLQNYSFSLHRTIRDLPEAALLWQPDSEANNIDVTVWHVCRALDLLKVKIIENKADSEQIWYSKGWAAKTNYDPAGLGFGGFGNLSGYSRDQVKEVPLLPAAELLEYFDQVYEALGDYLANVKDGALEESPIGWPSTAGASPESIYIVLMMFFLDNREHLGEIKALRAMWSRTCEK